jgi:Fic family protein
MEALLHAPASKCAFDYYSTIIRLMFNPKYTITHALLEDIKRIYSLVQRLNQRQFPHVVLVELQKNAEAVSSYASTSIEGNPLPLTDVKKILKNKPQNIRDSEREVLNYNEILKEINQKLAKGSVPITLNSILQIQKKVTNKLPPASQIS